jgi:DNA-binding transcriptional regulator PaaX
MDNKEKKLYKINPFYVGGSFLSYCVKQGWMIEEKVGRKSQHYITEEGIKELKEKFNIIIEKHPAHNEIQQ